MKAKTVYVQRASTPVSSGQGYILTLTIAAMAMSLISAYSVIIVLFGMLPGLIAMIIDQEARRYISKIVLSFNATGCLPFLLKVLKSSSSNAVAIEIIVDPRTWLTIYISASIGWFLYWILPYFFTSINNLKIQFRIQQLNFELERLVSEWGEEIKCNTK